MTRELVTLCGNDVVDIKSSQFLSLLSLHSDLFTFLNSWLTCVEDNKL